MSTRRHATVPSFRPLRVVRLPADELTMADDPALEALARHLARLLLRDERRAHPLATRIRYFAPDDSVFVNDEYVIKGLAGRILIYLLRLHQREGRCHFSNKELRATAALRLAGYQDNLEARLVLLRRRLEERRPALRVVKTGRGRFRLEVRGPLELVD